MEIAALLAAGLGDWIDFGVILAILLLNASVGFYQEKQAADVVASLKGDIALRCTVVRDGAEKSILARELVPGDIVRPFSRTTRDMTRCTLTMRTQVIIQEGDTVPADARLVCDYSRPEDFEIYKQLKAEERLGENTSQEEDDADEDTNKKPRKRRDSAGHPDIRSTAVVATDQSAITGESLAVDKYVGDLVYYTTGCKRGKAFAVVVTTARRSFVGRTAELVQEARDQGHFKAVMDSIGSVLLVLVMFWILAAWIGGFYRNLGIALPGSQNLLHYALVLLIIGVPVGLPVVTTTTLAVGAAYLAKQKAIVQKLTAIESLAVIYPGLAIPLCDTDVRSRESISCARTRPAR